MPKETKRNISIVGPTDTYDLRLTEPKAYAAGLPAIKIAAEHAMKEMGLSRSIETLSKLNQKEGIDCPGCAWPDPERRSKLGEFCENGVKAIAEEATLARVDRNFFAQYDVETLSHWTDFQIGKAGRLTEPMLLDKDENQYKPISWDASFELIAQELKALDGPDQAVFYTSGRSSNEAAFLYGLFARAFGTNNLPDCSNMCHESSGVALSETLGIGKGSVTLEDFEDAEVVMILGQNPGTNHPRMLSALEKCKDKGGKVVSINPIREAGLLRFKNPQEVRGLIGGGQSLTDIYLQVKINQDVALLKYLIKKLHELQVKDGGVFDETFIAEQTQGYAELTKDLETFSYEMLLDRAGLSAEEVEPLVQLLAEKKRIIICWAMGLTQHKNGVENIKECVNLLLLKGSVGIKGGGTCPVRGHSNVQGDRTVGIMHYVSKAFSAGLKKAFDLEAPTQHGLDVVHAIEAMHEGKAKVFVALGGNFLSAASDTQYTGEALQNCSLTVSISTKLNRTHLVTGKKSLILPTLGRTELDQTGEQNRFVTVENSMGRVHRSKGRLKPASEHLMSEPEIVASIGKAYFGPKSKIDWQSLGQDYALIRSKISEVFAGFEKYEERSAANGFDLPNNARRGDFSKLPGGRAVLSLCPLPEHQLEEDDFLLMSIRSHDQFNTTIYGLDDRYRGIYNERRVVLINAEDMAKHSLKRGDGLNLISQYKGVIRRAENFIAIPYDIPQGNLAAYFPETNVLIPYDQFADKSHTPISKSVRVKIEAR